MKAAIRVIMMGLAGYVSFAGFALLYLALAEFFELEIFPSVGWALEVGVIGAAIFLGSELFKHTPRGEFAFLRRILLASGVFIASGFITPVLSGMLGWHKRTYEEDPWWLHNLRLGILVFAVALVLARVLWIGVFPKSKP